MEILKRTIEGLARRKHGENLKKIEGNPYGAVPMVTVTERITGQVAIEIDIEQILNDLAFQALYNKSGSARALSGRIRAKAITKEIETTRKPSRWAAEPDPEDDDHHHDESGQQH